MLDPGSGVVGSGFGDMLLAWLSRVPIFFVSGFTVLVTAIVVLNAAGRAGRENLGLALLATVVGCLIAAVIRYLVGAAPAGEGAIFVLRAFGSWFVPAAALVAGYVLYLRVRATGDEANAAELRRTALEKQQLETRLRLLQAQIEPYFLFNTLSSVRRLCQSDARAGRAMLAQLTRYLRAALHKLRSPAASLADELELVSAILELQKVRMGPRLRVEFDVPAPLPDSRNPSLMLATLVENAIMLGIAPSPEGARSGLRPSTTQARSCSRCPIPEADSPRPRSPESGWPIFGQGSRHCTATRRLWNSSPLFRMASSPGSRCLGASAPPRHEQRTVRAWRTPRSDRAGLLLCAAAVL